MKPVKGYYSVIQYCPDLSRLEAANIGVLLFCPEINFLQARTAEAASRIRRFFGLTNEEKWKIEALRTSIEERLKAEKQHFHTIEDLEHFIATRATAIQITAPRAMKVFDPENDLNELFEQLVRIEAHKQQPQESNSLEQVLEKVFENDSSIKGKIEKNIRIVLPDLRPLEVPYGYKNGYFNLIQPVRFEGMRIESAFKEACVHAVEGEYVSKLSDLERGQLHLTVVGQFGPKQHKVKETVSKVLTEHKVTLYTEESLDDLLDDIREHGKILAKAS